MNVFFFNDTATTEIYTLSLHDALPIYDRRRLGEGRRGDPARLRERARAQAGAGPGHRGRLGPARSEEHTSELQSLAYLVCRLLLEKKKKYWNFQSRGVKNIGKEDSSNC